MVFRAGIRCSRSASSTRTSEPTSRTCRTEIPFNQTGLPLSLLPANFTGNELFLVTAPINTDGGPLKGFEINYQQPFRFLPGPLRNLGAILNFT